MLYIDSDDLPTTDVGAVAPGLLLQVAGGDYGDKPAHLFTRLVENADRRDITDNVTYYLKRSTAAWTLR